MKKLVAGLILALLASVSPALAQRVQNPQNAAVACAYNAAPPTLTSGWFGYAQCDSLGNLLVAISGGAGTTTVVGNVASGAADSGNPVKVGCRFNTTPPTLTDGQRGDCQMDLNANIRISSVATQSTGTDAVGNTLINYTGARSTQTAVLGLYPAAQFLYNGTSWDRAYACNSTAAVSVTAGSTTEIVALTASQIIRVCSFTLAMSAAGTAQFVYGTGANCGTGTISLTGAVPLATGTPWALSAPGPGTNVFRTASANALCVAAVTGNVVGFVTYAKY